MKLVFRLAAAADIEETYRWYEKRRASLDQEYLESVQGILNSVLDDPKAYPVVHRDTRRALLRRFPYGLFYRLFEGQSVVVACLHAKRDPRQWRTRP